VLICSAVLLIRPNLNFVLAAFIFTIPLNLGIQFLIPGLNYFVRAFLVIFISLTISFVGSQGHFNSLYSLFKPANSVTKKWGWVLAVSLLILHIVFH
jgi:hypothetical protein